MGFQIEAAFGSIGKVKNLDEPYNIWHKNEEELRILARKHEVLIEFKSQDQGNDGYYLAIIDSYSENEHISQGSIYFLDLSVKENPEFNKRLDKFIEELNNTESLSDFHNISFYEPAKLIFTQ